MSNKLQTMREDFSINILANVDLEKLVVGTLLVSDRAFLVGMEMLQSDVFFNEQARIAFECVRMDFDQQGRSDLLLASQRARQAFPGSGVDVSYLMELTGAVGSDANFEIHVRKLQELAMKRKLAQLCIRAHKELLTELEADVFDLQNNLIREVEAVSSSLIKSRERSMRELVHELIDLKREQQQSGVSGITGVTTGYDSLDAMTGGWKPGELTVLAARPSVGKSAFALNLCANAAEIANVPVVFFSLEMGSLEQAQRLLSVKSKVFSNKINNADLNERDWLDINRNLGKLESMPLYVDDTASLQMFELKSKVRRLKHQYGIGLVVVDYLQLMSGDTVKQGYQVNREQVISSISRGMKIMAKELSVPVIALAQLSRAVDQRGSAQPKLSDLRESGAIEQDADNVMFLWSDASDKPAASDVLQAQVINLTIAKQRNGSTGNLSYFFTKSYGAFREQTKDSPSPDHLRGNIPSITIQSSFEQPPF